MRRLGMPQNRSLTFNESDFKGNNLSNIHEIIQTEIIDKEEGKVFTNQDKQDVIRMLGYDPFEFENDKINLVYIVT
jgi:hypothetical protein